MPKYALIGGSFEQWDTPLSGDQHAQRCVLGSIFELEEDAANKLILNGAALLPLASFEALHFTPEEITKYPNAVRQQDAPAAFLDKLLSARLALHDYREQLRNAAVSPAPIPAPPPATAAPAKGKG